MTILGLPIDGAFAAAIVAALAALTTLAYSIVNDRLLHRSLRLQQGREHWWARFTWCIGELRSKNAIAVKVAAVTLRHLTVAKWATDADRELLLGMIESLKEPSK